MKVFHATPAALILIYSSLIILCPCLSFLRNAGSQAADEGLNRICTPKEAKITALAASTPVHSDDEILMELSSGGDDCCPIDGDFVFKPIYILGSWENEDEEMRVSVAILMPSGTMEKAGDHDLKVIDNGFSLEVSVAWPRAMTDISYLHKTWIDSDGSGSLKTHPRVLSFRPFLRRLRRNGSEKIMSSYKTSLPCQVKTDLSMTRKYRSYLKWDLTTERVLYVTMEAPDTNYAVPEACDPVFLEAKN